MNETTTAARHAITALLAGSPPNGVAPESVGEWGHILTQLYDAHRAGGTSDVRRMFDALTRANRGLTALVASDALPPSPTNTMPALPSEAEAVLAHLAPCGGWLNQYTAYACQAAPKAPRSFHEMAGLFAVSTVIARRLVHRAGSKAFYPNLYALLLADSGYGKTTALDLVLDLFRETRMLHFLAPQSMTPQGLAQEFSIAIPGWWQTADDETRSDWLKQRAFAAQRGWLVDETSGLFEGFKREFNAGMQALILQLYECPEYPIAAQTASKGRTTIKQPYLSFIGGSAPALMGSYLTDRMLWYGGLWARFLFVVPDRAPTWEFFPPASTFPRSVLDRFLEIEALFPARDAALEYDEAGDGPRRPRIAISGLRPPDQVVLEPGVWQAWEAYSRATAFDLALHTDVEPALRFSYQRFGAHVIKVAMLLATMDASHAPIHLSLVHFARAVQIVEGWRAALHQVWSSGAETDEAQLIDRVLAHLQKCHPHGRTVRELAQGLHTKTDDLRTALEVLRLAGRVETSKAGRRELWGSVPDAEV